MLLFSKHLLSYIELLEAVGNDRFRVEHWLLAGIFIIQQGLRLVEPLGEEG